MMQQLLSSIKLIGWIMNIDENDFRGVDLNLLVAFLVLMRERSVSAAAQKLFLGQPAVSGALARLRQLFDDELLVRTAKGMAPTPRALELEAAIGPAMQHLQGVITSDVSFDPSSAQRLFVIGMPDWVEHWLMPALLKQVRTLAPSVRVAVKESNPFAVGTMLQQDDIELGIGSLPPGPAWQRRQELREMGFRCVYDPDMFPFRGEITLEQYTSAPHLLVSYRGALEGAADEVLAERGLRREVCYSTPRFSSVPDMLGATAMVATVPEVLARRWEAGGGLVSCAVPVALQGFTVAMGWHVRRDNDPGLRWLTGLISALAVQA